MIRLNAEQIQMMKDELTVELADWLMETYGYSPKESLMFFMLQTLLNVCRILQQVSIFRV